MAPYFPCVLSSIFACQLNDPDGVPNQTYLDEGFFFTESFPNLDIEVGDRLLVYDSQRTLEHTLEDLKKYLESKTKSNKECVVTYIFVKKRDRHNPETLKPKKVGLVY